MASMRPLIAALLLAASLLPGRAFASPLRAGDPLPALVGRNLLGERVELPRAAAGRHTLLLLGFSYESRHAVGAWGVRFRQEFGADSLLACYELPMMSGFGARLGRPFIEGGMRGGTPAPLHRNVVVVWNEVGAWKRRLEVRDTDLAYLLLVDRAGRLVWSGTGRRDGSGFDALAARLREARAR